MILRALAASALLASAVAAAPVPRASDEFAYHVGGKEYLLGWKLEETFFTDNEVLAQFRRIGADSACTMFNRHYRPTLARSEPEFRPLLVAAVRSKVPAEVLLGDQPLGFAMGTMQARKGRIIEELETTGGALFARASGELRAAFLADAAAASPRTGSAGTFDDWDLEKPLARRHACMILRAGPPEHVMDRKGPFDGFYRRGDAR